MPADQASASSSSSKDPQTPNLRTEFCHMPGNISSLMHRLNLQNLQQGLGETSTPGPCLMNFMQEIRPEINANALQEIVSPPKCDPTEQIGFSFEEIASFQTKTKLRCCHFSSSGKLLAAAGDERKVLIWDMESHEKNIINTDSSLFTDIRFQPNSTVFATSSFDGNLQVWDVLKPIKSKSKLIGHAEPVMSLDFYPTNANILCSSDSSNEIRLWNVNESACIHAFKGGNQQVRFQPQFGNLLAAATGNIINMIDGAILSRFEGHEKDVNSICWHPSGQYLASVSEDCARIWSGGKTVHDLHSDSSKYISCTIHPAHALVLVIGSDQAFEIWNPIERQKVCLHRAHDGTISALANTHMTHSIASVSHDSLVKLWK